MKKYVAFVIALSAAATPALAQQKCWTSKEMGAARVRDLQSVLMVSALQCRTSGQDVLAAYNKFVVAGRTSIVAKNDVLKARFVRLQGNKEGQRAYDSFTTALANAHAMNSRSTVAFCSSMVALATEAAAAAANGDASDALELIGERLGERPMGVGDGCDDPKPKAVTAQAAPGKPTTVTAANGQTFMLVPVGAASEAGRTRDK